MRTYLSKYLYEQAKQGELCSFYHKDFISAKLVHLRQFDLKDWNINNNGEIELEKYYETLMAQATFRVKFRNNDGKKTTQYLVFQRIMSESNPFEKWKLVFSYDKTFPDDDQLVKQ